MKDVAASTALAVGLLAGAVQLLDWLLPPKAVDRISLALTHVWHWLSEQRAGSLLKWLRDSRPLKWLVATFLVVVLVFCAGSIIAQIGEPMMPMVEVVVVMYGVLPGLAASAAVFLFASYFRLSRLADWITSQETATAVLLRVAIVCALGAAITALAVIVFYFFEAELDPLPFVVAVSALFFIFLPVATFTLVWGAMLCWLIVVASLAGAIWTSEFLFRRLVEYPKGPVLAISALLAAIGGILKNLP